MGKSGLPGAAGSRKRKKIVINYAPNNVIFFLRGFRKVDFSARVQILLTVIFIITLK